MDEKYTALEMEIIRFDTKDVITASDPWELPED